MEGGDVTTKVTEKYATDKMNLKKNNQREYANEFMNEEEIKLIKLNKKLWVEGKVDDSLLKYFPARPKTKLNFLKQRINIVLFDKFDK